MAGDINVKMRLDQEGKFKNAVKEINSELKAMQSEIRAVDAASKGEANTLENLTRKQESLTKAQQKAADLEKKLAEAVANAQKNYDKAADQTKKYKEQLENAKKSGTATEKEISALTKAVADSEKAEQKANIALQDWTKKQNDAKVTTANLTAQVAENDKYIQEAKNSYDGTAKSIDEYGKSTDKAADSVEIMAEAMAAAGINAKLDEIKQALLDCAEAAETYETAMAKVATLTGGDVSQMGDDLLKMATDMGVAAPDLAESMYQALSASVDTADALEFVEKATKLAIGGFTEASTAVDVLTTIINAYGMKASDATRISDILVQTQNKGKTTVDALAQSLGQVIPTASAYNVNLENIAASYILLTRGGINTANATTYIRSMMTELGDASSDVSEILYDITGKNFAQLMSEGKSVGDVLAILSNEVNNNSTAFANLWGNQRAGQGALAIVNAGTEEFAGALRDLADAEGVAEENYQKMAGTSERATARLQTSFDNLKIAIGQQLLEPLNNIKGKIADVVIKITEWVKANPQLVKAIGAIITGLTILGATMTAYVTITKLAQVVTKAFSDIIAGSTVGKIVLAVTAVISAIAALVALFGDMKDESAQLADDMAKLAKEHKEAAEEYEKSAATFKKSMKAAADQTERATQAEEAYNTALERRKAILVENAEAEDAAEEAAAALNETEEDFDERIQRIIKNGGDATLVIQEQQRKVKNLTQAQEDANKVLKDNAEQLRKVETDAKYYSLAMAELDETSREAVDAFLLEADAMDQNNPKYQLAIERVYEMTQAHDELAAAIQTDIDSINNEMENLQAEYDAAYDKAYSSLNGQFGLFETVSIKTAQSVSEMITALESQAQYMETYAANLEKAIQLGLSDSLVQALSDGSAESAAILQSIVEDGGQNIDALNQKFEQVQEGKDAFSQQMAEAATDFDNRMSDIENRLGQAVNKMNQANAAYSAAVDTIRGNIAGAESMRGQLTNEYASLARAASQAYRNELQIRSPSKVMEKNAVYTVEGIIEGARKMLPKVEQTFDDIGAATVGSYGAGASSYSAPDIGQYNVAPTTVVNVHLGDRELTNVMYSGIVKKIESTNRNASAAAGRI